MTAKGTDDKNQNQIERVLESSGRPDDAPAEQPAAPDVPPDRTRQFTHVNFSRMRTSWAGEDQVRLAEVKAVADDIIADEFKAAFAIIDRMHRHVRTPKVDPGTGEILSYPDGSPQWETDEYGVPEEDWGLLEDRERSNLLLAINSFLFEWELKAVDKWAEAMYAKVMWEEKFAGQFTVLPGFTGAGRPTIDDRTQWGHLHSAGERYFSVFQSVLSRKADALVRSMVRLSRVLENTSTR